MAPVTRSTTTPTGKPESSTVIMNAAPPSGLTVGVAGGGPHQPIEVLTRSSMPGSIGTARDAPEVRSTTLSPHDVQVLPARVQHEMARADREHVAVGQPLRAVDVGAVQAQRSGVEQQPTDHVAADRPHAAGVDRPAGLAAGDVELGSARGPPGGRVVLQRPEEVGAVLPEHRVRVDGGERLWFGAGRRRRPAGSSRRHAARGSNRIRRSVRRTHCSECAGRRACASCPLARSNSTRPPSVALPTIRSVAPASRASNSTADTCPRGRQRGRRRWVAGGWWRAAPRPAGCRR